MSNTPKTPADAGPDLQRAVRPLYYWHEGPNGDCFRVETDEAESDAPCPHCAPRYDQAALDAAVAAERERCAHVCNGIASGYAGDARRLDGQRATHAAGQRDGANECAAAIRRA